MAKATRKIDPEQIVETPRPGKRVSASRSEMTEVVLPQDCESAWKYPWRTSDALDGHCRGNRGASPQQ